MAGGIQLEYCAQVRGAAKESGPIEVASSVADHTHVGSAPIRYASEGVQHGLMAGHIQLVYNAQARCAADRCGPVKIAGRVPNQASGGPSSVRATCEAVQRPFT